MGRSSLFAFEWPDWLAAGVLVPAAVGGVAGVAVVALLHFVLRPRVAGPAPAPPPAPDLDPFIHGSASEQRQAYRRGGSLVEVKVRPPGRDAAVLTGWVLDRAAGGLGLKLDRQFPAGMVLQVRPLNASPLTPWVEVEVKSALPGPDGWRLGCQFVRQPTWAVLMSFG
jgi:hypothetical protein